MNATYPTMLLAIAWMTLLGWGFQALLRRHLRLDDRLADLEAQLAVEQHARETAERALSSTHMSLCKLAKQQETVREAERQRIGRDIHDDLGQNLLALRIDLSLLHVSTTGAHPQITQKVDSMMGNLDQTIASLRAVINDLRPLALSAGLATAIASQLADLSRMHNVEHQLRAEPGVFDCPPDDERDAAVFRILQETLCNVARHAHATQVVVELQRCGGVLTMSVRDNGVGMPSGALQRGSGLPGIRERAAAIGGKVVVESKPGVGTLVRLSYPVPQAYAVQ
ncbi:sensor histidine kinase [Massilia sp. PAMC28688]|uniref:sensor histidine kinase n=1 Tax=Massilia sp. PAMC28688 TaxID=2861283 RepID=UPI001C6284A2|nr:sensor histidine kinase [Massilia sp. PAMC28688]QYF92939.1 sensor histidine kinase [Massilia sp. PAMC28688]